MLLRFVLSRSSARISAYSPKLVVFDSDELLLLLLLLLLDGEELASAESARRRERARSSMVDVDDDSDEVSTRPAAAPAVPSRKIRLAAAQADRELGHRVREKPRENMAGRLFLRTMSGRLLVNFFFPSKNEKKPLF